MSNTVPTIGVMMTKNTQYPELGSFYILEDYINALRVSCARVRPIWLDQPKEYYYDQFTSLNGLLIPDAPGGLQDQASLVKVVKWFWEFAKQEQASKPGSLWPIWGIGLGMECVLACTGMHEKSWSTSEEKTRGCMRALFTQHLAESALVKTMPPQFVQLHDGFYMLMAYRSHITWELFCKENLDSYFKVVITYEDGNQTGISLVESKELPAFGCNIYPISYGLRWQEEIECGLGLGIIELTQMFLDAFVQIAHGNTHSISSRTVEAPANRIIEYYNPTELDAGDRLQTVYFFGPTPY